jgi:formylglycine-generating enzyme required for sulfatase activity
VKAGVEPSSFVSTVQTAQLLKQLRSLAGDQAQELTLLRDDFADPEELARLYVEPHLQERSPGGQEGVPPPVPRQPAFALLNQFLGSGPLQTEDSSHQLFLLGEAGCGKTSLLLLLKLLFLSGSWPQNCRCELFRIGPETLAQLAAVARKGETILLLDGLNHDRAASRRLRERLLELLEAGAEFRRVIVTCRTHFFPGIKIDRAGRQVIQGLEGYNCPVLHLSPFDSQQMQELLRRQLVARSGYLGLQGFGAGRQRLRDAFEFAGQSPLLRQSPLFLRHVGMLLAADAGPAQDIRSLCHALFQQWLQQCRQHLQKVLPDNPQLPDCAAMRRTCIKLACWLEKLNRNVITAPELQKLFCRNRPHCWLELMPPDQDALLEKKSNGSIRFRHPIFREFLLACALKEEPPPFPVRATDMLVHFLELAGGISQHLNGLDFANFHPHRYVERHGARLVWQEQFSSKRGRAQRGPELIMLPGGRFLMGDQSGQGQDNARPVHAVELDSFGLCRFPVTFAEYDEFCLATGRARPPDNGWGRAQRPVINVSWQDAVDYCAWLIRQTGRHYRLPTEAEWEYACRAGSRTDYCFGDDSEQLEGYAWHVRNSERQTQPVGGRKANAWGLHDMHGNVWEWCADWYAKDCYIHEPMRNPFGAGAEHGAGRVLRGGSWDSSAKFVASHFRFCLSPGLSIVRAGFRVALGA